MKTFLAVVFLAFSVVSGVAGPIEDYIMDRTNRMYPTVLNNASPLGRAVNAEITWFIANRPSVVGNPIEYEKMVARNADRLGIKPIPLDMEKEELYRRDAQFRDAYEQQRNSPAQTRPTQYNGRPLPRNWIDPKQADDNFRAQQLRDELARQAAEIQRLQQQRR